MRISVAIPTFMRADNLARTLKSFYIQDFPKKDYELIVVDDGGSDNTKEVCDEAAKHCNVRYFYRNSAAVREAWTEGSSLHQGTANRRWNIVFAYNIALRRAQGDIFMVTTADNMQISPTLSQMLKWHDDHKGDPVCVGGKLEYHLKEGVWPKQEDWGNLPAWLASNKGGVFDLICRDAPFQYCYSMPRHLLVRIGGYDEDYILPAYEDADFITRLAVMVALKMVTVHMDDRIVVAHQWHSRSTFKDAVEIFQRKTSGFIVRNQGRDWGVL